MERYGTRVMGKQLLDVSTYSADTEFPGIVARPVGNYRSGEFHYQTLRCSTPQQSSQIKVITALMLELRLF